MKKKKVSESYIKSKYIEARFNRKAKVTSIWDIVSKKHNYNLGQVKWYSHWRQYCFFPDEHPLTVFNSDCLKSITTFIDKLNEEHREYIKKKKKQWRIIAVMTVLYHGRNMWQTTSRIARESKMGWLTAKERLEKLYRYKKIDKKIENGKTYWKIQS